MQFPITIGLRRSRFIDVGVMVFALVASVAALSFPQSLAIQSIVLLLIVSFSGLAWWKLTPTMSALRLERSGQVFIRRKNEDVFVAVEMLPGMTVHPWLTVVKFRSESAETNTLIATVDSLKRQDFRKLRVFFRWLADFQINGPNDVV